MLYEIAIAGRDEPDHHPVTKRVKEGDIVAIRPAPFHWGLMEIKHFLIVLLDIDADFHDLAEQLCSPLYGGQWDRTQLEDLCMPPDGAPDAEAAAVVASGIYARPCRIKGTSQYMEFPQETAKRRFYLHTARIKDQLPELDLAKMRDRDVIYQPFKRKSALVARFQNERYQATSRISDGRTVIRFTEEDPLKVTPDREDVVDAGTPEKEELEISYRWAKDAVTDLVYDRIGRKRVDPEAALTAIAARRAARGL